VDREVDLERWREAGKEIGRKVGVVEERNRIIALLHKHISYKDFGLKDFLIREIKGENE
jgi:hypothetical protein